MFKLIIVVSLLVAAIELNSLVSVVGSPSGGAGRGNIAAELEPLKASANYYQDIAALLVNFDRPKEQATAKTVQKSWEMQVEQQANQQGLLDKLYSGEYKYRLMATFNQSDDFALLLKTHQLTNETSLVKLKTAQNLDQYQVEQIEHNQLTLDATGRKITLTVFNVKKV